MSDNISSYFVGCCCCHFYETKKAKNRKGVYLKEKGKGRREKIKGYSIINEKYCIKTNKFEWWC